MNKWSKSRFIWKKEMRSLMRDKKALLTIFLPIVIYPVMMMFFFGLLSIVEGHLGKESRTVAFMESVPAAVQEVIAGDEKIEIYPLGDMSIEAALSDEIIDVVIAEELHGEKRVLQVYHHSSKDSSNRGKALVTDLLEDYKRKLITERIETLTLSSDLLEVVTIEHEQITEDTVDERVIASVLGLVAPFILVMYSIIGIYSISSDLSAGEKERSTLETIFSVPVPKVDIMLGKLFAGVTVGFMAGLANILSMLPIIYALVSMIEDLSISLNAFLPFYILLMLLPVMMLTVALMIMAGLFAKTFQEAQSYGSFIMMGLMLPCYIGMIPSLELDYWMALLPIANAILAMRQAFIGDYSLVYTLLILVVNSGLAYIAIYLMARFFSSENVILGHKNDLDILKQSA